MTIPVGSSCLPILKRCRIFQISLPGASLLASKTLLCDKGIQGSASVNAADTTAKDADFLCGHQIQNVGCAFFHAVVAGYSADIHALSPCKPGFHGIISLETPEGAILLLVGLASLKIELRFAASNDF